jgi:hypothetical protein
MPVKAVLSHGGERHSLQKVIVITTKISLESSFARSITSYLNLANDDLSSEIKTRLEFSRKLAISQAKRTSVANINGGSSILSLMNNSGEFWPKIFGMASIIVLFAGLIVIDEVQSDNRAIELANIDQAILTDWLPPSAYLDQGFIQYLKTSEKN